MKYELIYFLRILLACFCGGCIGIERQLRTKGAGTRTHVMIAMASALMMVISKYGFFDVIVYDSVNVDASRVAAGIITGIGIIGGGLIFVGKQGYVSGLTTTAGIWATVAVGMSAGAGMYLITILSTLLVVFIQLLFHKDLWIVKQATKACTVFKLSNEQSIDNISEILKKDGIELIKYKYEDREEKLLTCQIVIPAKYSKTEIFNILNSIPEIISFEIS